METFEGNRDRHPYIQPLQRISRAIGSLLDLGGQSYHPTNRPFTVEPMKSDTDTLREDWQAIGDEIRNVTEQSTIRK